MSINVEQQVSDTLGVFARAGWANGNVEPWDFTDIDRPIRSVSRSSGKRWGRPDDTIGIAGVLNGIPRYHAAYFNAGGLGILIGDGQLPNRVWSRSSRPITATRLRPRRGSASIISSSPIPPTTPSAGR